MNATDLRHPTLLTHIAQRFNHTAMRADAFVAGGRLAGMAGRDLGLRQATGGLMRAEHLRRDGPGAPAGGWQAHDLDFHFLYVLRGRMGLRTGDGEDLQLGPGDCVHVPAGFRHAVDAGSPDLELVEIAAPADGGAGQQLAAPAAGTPARVAQFMVSRDRPDAYRIGEGPRRFLAYRDPGVTDATGRRVNVNIVRNSVAGDQSTGWHYHTLACQFVFVLSGWSRVEVDGAGEFLLHAGDAMTLPRGLKHDVTGFSADFTVLELNIPADYDTIACPAPSHAAPPNEGVPR